MKKILLFLLYLFLGVSSVMAQTDYLKKILGNLEAIKSATYNENFKAWEPGDTIPVVDERLFCIEYANPADTIIGSSFVVLNSDVEKRFEAGYNGEVNVTTFHDKKGIMIDDFTHRNLPIRHVEAPFFNVTENIIRYILETGDSISIGLNEYDDHYYLKLMIYEETQVEFSGKAYHMPEAPFAFGDPTSQYEMWISKSSGLPYQYRREMSHSISSSTCSNVELNKLSIEDFDLFSYFPEGYEIRKYGEKRNVQPLPSLVGTKAPNWTL